MISKRIFLFSALLIFLGACKSDPLDIDTSNVSFQTNYIHLDSILVNTPEDKLLSSLKSFHSIHPEILDYQLGHCLGVGSLKDTGTIKRIKLFTNDPFIKRIEKHISTKFSSLNKEKSNINTGFKHLKYHFPSAKTPSSIVFMNSFFASSVFCTEKEIGIGLERYLGEKTDVIQELPSQDIFQWVKEGMNPDFLERDVLTAWIMTHLVPEDNENTAAAIIRWGKIIYLTEACFPKEKKNIILRYTEADYKWALENEYAFWKYLVDEKLLFSTNERDRSNFLSEGPFTIGLPEKGPDRLGQFLGWKMIHSYLKENPSTTPKQLINIHYNQILQAYEVE